MSAPAFAAATTAVESIDAGPAVTSSVAGSRRMARIADQALRLTAASWLTVASLGQLLFVFYVVTFYGRAVVQGRFEDWKKVLSTGYSPGHPFDNAVLFSHLLFAAVVTAAGVLQLVPLIRRRWPRFHRWSGRVFVVGAVLGAAGGVIMTWTRQSVGDLSQHLASMLDAALILTFAALAWRDALKRRFDTHRRWAMRMFLAVNGGWFFRIGLMLWIVVNHGPVGFDPKTFTGPFLTFLSFAEYLLPLAVLQLYFHAQASRDARLRLATAGALTISTLATAGGIAAAFAILWLPHL
jgi:hypothetical protein